MKVFLKRRFIIFIFIIAAGCRTLSNQHLDDGTSDKRKHIQTLDDGIRELTINAPIDNVIRSAEEILQNQGESFAGIVILKSEAKITTKFRVIDKSDLVDVAVTDSIVKQGWQKGGYTFAVHFLAHDKLQTRVQVRASFYGTFSDAPLSVEQFHLWQRMQSRGVIEVNFLEKLSKVSEEKNKTTWP